MNTCTVFLYRLLVIDHPSLLQAAYKELPDSNVPPAVPAGDATAMSLLGRHAGALVQTLTNLVADGQVQLYTV